MEAVVGVRVAHDVVIDGRAIELGAQSLHVVDRD